MPKMKDSGIEWVGQIPEHWNISKIKYSVVCRDSERIPVDKSLRTEGEYPYWGAGSIMDYIDRYIFDDDLVLLGEDGAPFFDKTRDVAHHISGKCWINNHIHVLQGIKGICDNSFLTHILNSVDYGSYINGSILNKLTQGNMMGIDVALPDIDEQHRIADYIDHKCSEIDSLRAGIEAEIETLEEYKKSVITEVVTKGLDKNVQMKDSGIEWIGQIPIDWDTSRLGYESYIRARLGWKGLKAEEYIDEGYAFISAFNIQNGSLIWNPLNFITKERYDESPEIKLHVGDVLLVKDGAGVGKSARVDELPEGATAPNSSLAVVTPYERLEYRYLGYYLKSSIFLNFVNRLLNGMGVPHLTQEVTRNIKILLPSIPEQMEISDYLDKKCAEVDDSIRNKKEQLDVLADYKKSLIYEYVTGKKKVE